MRAGKLNRTISIRYPVTTARSTDGAPIVTTSTLIADVWAAVDPKAGTETYRDRNRWEVDEVDFFIRYTTVGITNSMWVNYGDADYDIKAIIDVDESHRQLQLITKRHA